MAPKESESEIPGLEITKEFLEKLTKREIVSFKIAAGSNAGDNYMSVMHAVEIRLKGEKEDPLYIVVKCVPNHPSRREFAEDSNVFRKEFFVYDQWIPTLLKFRDEVGAPSSLQLAVATYLGGQVPEISLSPTSFKDNSQSELSYIGMVDLRKTFGFKMADRQVGLDYEHCKIVIEELAKFHAFSWAFKQNKGMKYLTDTYPMMLEAMYHSSTVEQFRDVMTGMLDGALNHIEASIGSDSPVYHRTAKLKEIDTIKEMQSFLERTGADEAATENLLRIKPTYDPNYNMEPWLVGCHGDCWVNNFLFKYDETTGKPEKVILLDLQICMEACPTYDLIYFFYSSTTKETRKNYEDTLLRLYHDKFVEYCTALNCDTLLPGFNLSTLKRRFHRAKIIGYMVALPLLTFVLKDPETSIDLDTMDKNTDFGEMMTSVTEGGEKNLNLRKRVCDLSQELYDVGVL